MNSVLHNAVWMRSMHIGFALNLHWTIQLLNRFESGFSVDAPLVIQQVTHHLYTNTYTISRDCTAYMFTVGMISLIPHKKRNMTNTVVDKLTIHQE